MNAHRHQTLGEFPLLIIEISVGVITTIGLIMAWALTLSHFF